MTADGIGKEANVGEIERLIEALRDAAFQAGGWDGAGNGRQSDLASAAADEAQAELLAAIVRNSARVGDETLRHLREMIALNEQRAEYTGSVGGVVLNHEHAKRILAALRNSAPGYRVTTTPEGWLEACGGWHGIYDEFDGPVDAIRQLRQYIDEAHEAIGGVAEGTSLAGTIRARLGGGLEPMDWPATSEEAPR